VPARQAMDSELNHNLPPCCARYEHDERERDHQQADGDGGFERPTLRFDVTPLGGSTSSSSGRSAKTRMGPESAEARATDADAANRRVARGQMSRAHTASHERAPERHGPRPRARDR